MGRKTYDPDTAQKRARCQHSWCSDCRTRRGRNQGNRRDRRVIRALLRRFAPDPS